ncbi:hypothetical protein JSQ81_02295 [Sporosarcina sp. Marseille-Q4063]|uniref:DUF2651 family protein n=1 Tax=Sporosarcina sp. Marseille-Q4063 TaxID=2810514 RepID=UPI001BAEEF11|nr:hypothetical protein [Sporosarcina sp. Marseille-Q4063]QUW22438.1 hypothetical protein JSQ81_02295 [Sporosarcina sp. Marseille-Q4063]
MNHAEFVDPFLMQLVIIPIVVIGLGVLMSVITKKVFVGPIVTLVLNLIYEVWHFKKYYPDLELQVSSWNIIFPIISLMISWSAVKIIKKG